VVVVHVGVLKGVKGDGGSVWYGPVPTGSPLGGAAGTGAVLAHPTGAVRPHPAGRRAVLGTPLPRDLAPLGAHPWVVAITSIRRRLRAVQARRRLAHLLLVDRQLLQVLAPGVVQPVRLVRLLALGLGAGRQVRLEGVTLLFCGTPHVLQPDP